MSIQLGNLISHILLDHFGDLVERVGSDLFRFGSKTVPLIMMTTELPKIQIRKSLSALIKYRLVDFEPSKTGFSAEYKLNNENVLLLLRYPRYILRIKNKFGIEAEMIIEEMLQEGTISLSDLILNIMINKGKDEKSKSTTIISLRDNLRTLATAGYICRAAELMGNDTTNQTESDTNTFPELDLKALTLRLNDENVEIKDDVLWRIEMDRFHQDFRDELLIQSMVRSIDECGGELMTQLLQFLHSDKQPWVQNSRPIPFVELKERCTKFAANCPLLLQYLEQYLTIMENNFKGVINCSGAASGGQYTLRMAHAWKLLVWDLLCSTVQERLGTKAARIFRLIKSKRYIEEDNIQKYAMLPAKEAKQLTYKLLEEHFIEIRPLRKTASGNAGPSKTFYLYYIDLDHVANMLLESTYKALYNIISRREHERSSNKYLIDKQQRVDAIAHNMRLRGESEENIKDVEETVTPPEKSALERITSKIGKLSGAEIHLDDTLFILQIFLMYRSKTK